MMNTNHSERAGRVRRAVLAVLVVAALATPAVAAAQPHDRGRAPARHATAAPQVRAADRDDHRGVFREQRRDWDHDGDRDRHWGRWGGGWGGGYYAYYPPYYVGPPAPPVYTQYGQAVWVPDGWQWDGFQYVWVPGHWSYTGY